MKVEAGTITDVPPGASGTSFWKLTGSGGAYTLIVTNAIDYELPAVGGAGIYLSMLLGTGPCVPRQRTVSTKAFAIKRFEKIQLK